MILPSSKVCVAVVTMNALADKKRNIEVAEHWILQAHSKGAQWVVLPEMFCYLGPAGSALDIAETSVGPMMDHFAKIARKLKIVLFCGTFPEKVSDHPQKVYNTFQVYSTDGEMVARYRKRKLFDLNSVDGKKLYCESEQYLAGDQTSVFAIGDWHIGLAVCFDLRFANHFHRLKNQDPKLNVLVIPSAFSLETGRVHWEILLRARAIEYQCYVIAPNQVGVHGNGKSSYGHSLIIDPWGAVMVDGGEQEGVHCAEVDLKKVYETRQRIPMDFEL